MRKTIIQLELDQLAQKAETRLAEWLEKKGYFNKDKNIVIGNAVKEILER